MILDLESESAIPELMVLHYRTQMTSFMREMDILMNGSAVNEDLYSMMAQIR